MRRDKNLALLGREKPLEMIQDRKEIAELAIQELIQAWAQNRQLEMPIENIYSAVLSFYSCLRPYIKKYMAGYYESLQFIDDLLLKTTERKEKRNTIHGEQIETMQEPAMYQEINTRRLKWIYDVLDEAYVEMDFGAPAPLAWDTTDVDDIAMTDEFYGDANELEPDEVEG